MTGIDLDAILGELSPHPLTYKTREFTLPAELPGAALAPFLSEELGLIDLVADVMDTERNFSIDPETGAKIEEGITDVALRVLRNRTSLPLELLAAAKASLTALLDADKPQSEEFFALSPSINAYWALAQRITGLYAFGFADFFGSPDSSPAGTGGGEPSKATSSESTDSTPAVSGDVLTIPASSEPAASSS